MGELFMLCRSRGIKSGKWWFIYVIYFLIFVLETGDIEDQLNHYDIYDICVHKYAYDCDLQLYEGV